MTDYPGGVATPAPTGPGLFYGVKLFPVVPFAPVAGQNAVEFNSPLIENGGTFYNAANPTRLTIPAIPGGGANMIGEFTGNLSFLGTGTPDVSIWLLADGAVVAEGTKSAGVTGPAKLSFSTGPIEVSAGDYYELMYEFSAITDEIIQIVGTNLSFTYLGNDD